MPAASLIAASYFLRCFFACVLFLSSALVFAKTAYLDIYPVISADKKTHVFKVKQIARLKNSETMGAVDIARINATTVVLPLGSFESRQYIQGAVIKNAILAGLGAGDDVLVDINAPPRVVLKFKAGADISASVVSVAKKALEAHLNQHYQKSYISLTITPEINYDGELRFVPRGIAGLVKNRTAVWVDVFNEGGLVQSVPVWFEVQAQMDVLVLKSAVARGDVVSRKHFVIKSRDINGLPAEVVRINEMSDEQFGDFVYSGNVLEREVLDRRLIKKVKAINFGDDVKVISKSGRVSITTNAIAQGSAEIGDNVKLMAVESKEIFTGKVVARKQVVVEANP